MTNTSEYQNLLVLIQSFETLWAYYSQSDGQIYDQELRGLSRSMSESVNGLAASDSRLCDQLENSTVNRVRMREILTRLDHWANSDDLAPFENLVLSRSMLFGLLSSLKIFLHVQLQIPIMPTIAMSAREIEHSERALRWKGYLPDDFLRTARFDPDELVRRASGARSIVVVGDIRRSQQLMEYVMDADGFSNLMGAFIQRSMELIHKHKGFFDKFTGDGFIAYFNEFLCGELGLDFVECFTGFVREESDFAATLFGGLAESGLELTEKQTGLAIGCDIGQVDFRDVDNHFIAVGDSVVWAHRMSSAGEAGEIIAHYSLHDVIKSRPGMMFDSRQGFTKNGMPFIAQSVSFD